MCFAMGNIHTMVGQAQTVTNTDEKCKKKVDIAINALSTCVNSTPPEDKNKSRTQTKDEKRRNSRSSISRRKLGNLMGFSSWGQLNAT